MSKIEPRLHYSYATIDLTTGECLGCMTYSFEIINEAYIPVAHAYSSYVGKYYDRETGIWYYEPEHITVFDPEA